MVNEAKALIRVSEWLGLREMEKRKFIETASQLSQDTLSQSVSRYDERYLEHLNSNVFPQEVLVDLLQDLDISENRVQMFQSGEVPIEDAFRTWNEIQYSVNEVLDFTMLLKLIQGFSQRTLVSGLDSRYRLQKLVYLVNKELAESDNPQYRGERKFDYGLLGKTGFRYSYRKRDSGPFARQLEEDKNRLFASNLIVEEVADNSGTPEINEQSYRYRIELGEPGERVVERFTDTLSDFDNLILADWEMAINNTLDQYAGRSISELHSEINQFEDVQKAKDRDMLLKGRRMRYESQSWMSIPEFGVEMNV